MIEAPTQFRHPDRVRPRFRPLKAIGHFRVLMKDKEDTEQALHIYDCLPRQRFVAEAEVFCSSEFGQKIMAGEPFLPTILDNHDELLKLPSDSVAHAYVEFMRREGLSAAGLVAESDKMGRTRYPDQMQWYGNRLRDTHDLFHVLTGYGRDALGEQCVLAFTYGQDGAWGGLFLSYAGGLELKRRVKSDARVMAAIREGERNGRGALKIYEQDVMALLAEPLDAARMRLNIPEPGLYREAHRRYRARGIDPYNFLAAAQAA